MTYETQQLSPCRIAATAAVAAEQVGSERERIVSTWAHSVRLDGFRKGKAPRHLVQRHYGKEIEDDVLEGLVRTAWDEVRRGEKFRTAGPVDVKATRFREDGSFEVTVEVDVYPEVDIPDVAGFTASDFDVTPTPAEVDQAIEQLRERQAVWEPVEDEAVAAGFLVETEVYGEFPDGGGEPFHEERSLFQLGRGEVYPEIEAAVTGAKIGDEVRAERILPDDAGEERAGRRIAYQVTVKSLRRKRVPEADEAFASSLGVEGGVAALRERLGERVRAEKTRHRYESHRQELVRFLGGENAIPLPEPLLQEETRKELVDLATAFAERGIDPRTQVEWDKLEPEVRERVSRKLRAELVLDALVEKLGIAVGDAEVDAEVEKQAAALKVPFAELKGNLGKRGGLERIRALLQRERAVGRVLDRAGKEG